MWNNFKSGLFAENPVLALYLGICSVLACSTTLNNAIGMGVCVILTLIASNVIISLMRKIVPNEIRIPVYIVVIASLVTLVKMLVQAYASTLYDSLGAFIDLIVVNCIILGRAEAYASKNGVVGSIMDALGMGLGYTLALVVMALFRQILGTGSLSFFNTFNPSQVIFDIQIFPSEYGISFLTSSSGAFFAFAIFAGLMAMYLNNKADKEKAKELAAKKAAAAAAKAAAAAPKAAN